MKQKPEVKQEIRRGKSIYWMWCPKCGNGKERVAKVAASKDLKEHRCDG